MSRIVSINNPFILIITGASGTGKSTLLNLLKKTNFTKQEVTYIDFDDEGVPPKGKNRKQVQASTVNVIKKISK